MSSILNPPIVRSAFVDKYVDYENGCELLIQLYEILIKAPGVYGARFSGAGFHGCCIAFVDADCANEAASFVRNEYLKLQPKLASQRKSSSNMRCR
ncbi:hypothetical protein Vadar_023633 [Vaccinium darrowii]|uniref:Uncharacterized protein n=1 Tax=Vaccinium darrowii TaxID=229202 RepID=A0ACB7ZKV2_9ERIC|nr:hypothetical protein Vadar_023633 [Vaccinium darrowii]